MKATWLFCLLVFCSFAVRPATVDELKLRIKEIGEELDSIRQDKAALTAKINHAMRFSGYTDVEYRVDGDSDRGFRLHHTNLYINKLIAEKWRFFAEIEYEDAPEIRLENNAGVTEVNGGGTLFLEASNVDFLYRSFFSMRFGRMFTPAGIWLIDHDPPFVPTQERPLFVRHIFPQVVDGVMFYGVKPIGGSFFKYHVYLGNGEGNSGGGDDNKSRAFGGSVSLLLPMFTHTEIGASILSDPQLSGPQQPAEKTASGFHIKVNKNKLHLQAEYAFGEQESALLLREYTGAYIQAYIDWGSWTLGARVERYDMDAEPDAAAGNEPDFDTARRGLFVNYHLGQNILFKLEQYTTTLNNNRSDLSIASLVIFLGE